MATGDIRAEVKNQGTFSRAYHSIRTRYSLATAIFLLVILAMFYVGGRIVLVHFLRDTESLVQGIGTNISRLVNRDADRMCRIAAQGAEKYDVAVASARRHDMATLLDEAFGLDISLVVRLDDQGAVLEGCITDARGGSSQPVSGSDLSAYALNFAEWARTADRTNATRAAGILSVGGRTHYGALARCRTGGFLLLATPFDMKSFALRMNEGLSGMEIRLTTADQKTAADLPMAMRPSPHSPSASTSRYGIVPMVSEAISFYSGGFWEFNTNPMEAAFTVRDIAGNPVSVIAVSLPRSLSNVTTSAMSRLTFFIAMAGIILILPIFWFQSHILLNPLTRMIESIRRIGEHHDDTDCPRLVWTGQDEFAQLAISVNSMLETLSRRAVTVAQSESRLKALLANLPDGLVVFDRRHLVVAVTKQPDGVNPIPGIAEGCPLNASAYEDDASRKLGHALDGVLADGKSRSLNLNTSEASGERRSFELRLARMDEFFILSSIRDVTAEQAEHDLRVAAEGSLARLRKQESLSLLAAGIAHDVNNVLAVVMNTMEITWMDEKDPLITSALDTIRDAVKRGTGMMHELMTFAGETKINLRRCDPAELINAVSRLAAGPLGDKVSINYVLPEGLPAIDADPDQFWRIFFNLAKNAADAMNGQPGEIAVSADVFEMTPELAPSFTGSRALKPGPGVLFWVSDNGPGIPPEIQKRIFDPYVSTKSSGHGLGLAIAASIVAAHGGGISVQSDPSGGTTFSIFIPESRLSADVEAPVAAETGNLVAGDVLVVDDDKGILMTSQILLKALGHAAHAAADPDTALDAFRRFAPRLSCVILDANLANFDSVHLLRAFRLADARVPVIVSSGGTADATAEMFKAQPYNGFLAKPYTLAELKGALAKYGRTTA